MATVQDVCDQLQGQCRALRGFMRSRVMQENHRRAFVASNLGYSSQSMVGEETAAQRKALFDAAEILIKKVQKQKPPKNPDYLTRLILTTTESIRLIRDEEDKIADDIEETASHLPVADWVYHPDQRGFGIKSLGMIVGEAGNLTPREPGADGKPQGYTNPAKLWKRMGCAPFHSEARDQTWMGSTWKKMPAGKKLTDEEWTLYGYCPRRRSVMYVIAECLVKQNKLGPYKTRYNEAKKAVFAAHPEYESTDPKKKGLPGKRCDLHAKLLMAKLLLKNLWREWNPKQNADYFKTADLHDGELIG